MPVPDLIETVPKRFTDLLSPALIVVLGFLAAVFIGSILLMLPCARVGNQPLGFINSLFTATSAVCVTGLIVVDTGSYFSTFGQLVILSLIQMGGLGIMTFSTMFTLLIGKQAGLRGSQVLWDTLSPRGGINLSRLLKSIAVFTFGIELVGIIPLAFRFIPLHGVSKGVYSAVFHSISAFCNAGFSLNSDSLMAFAGDWLVNIDVMILIVSGGLGFIVLQNLSHAIRDRRNGVAFPERVTLQTKVVLGMSAGLIVAGALFFYLAEADHILDGRPWQERVFCSIFQSVTPRTAGFNTIDTGALQRGSLFFTIVLMFIGGSPGSTAGGVKTTTIAVAAVIAMNILKNKRHYHLAGRTLSQEIANRVVVLLLLTAALLSLASLVLFFTEPLLTTDGILFEVFSAFGTVGLSTGVTPALSSIGRLIMVLLMFIGRVGPLTLVLAISQRRVPPAAIRYADGKIMIG
ncbi:Trk family potassium uptake protein [bacterium]|nr:Trk family potassium uptake protein [candidate division CSSED10-310 bacterium]